MTFGLNMTAQADQLRRAQTSPLDPTDLNPGFMEGSLKASVTGLARGVLAKPAVFLGEAITPAVRPITRDLDTLFGTDLTGFVNDQSVQRVRALKSFTPDPETTGMAGQVLHSLFDIIPGAVVTGGVGAGALEGVAQAKLAQERGVDERTAILHGAVQGVATGIGVAIPLSIGVKAPADLAWAAASNVVPNMAARGASHVLLETAGYTEMASQYKALDAEAIMADATLGIFFAGAGRLIRGIEAKAQARMAAKVKPDDLDAALTSKAQHHLELDSAPGIPRDAVTRDSHVQAAIKASDDLLAGRPVNVGQLLDEADFQPDPARRAYVQMADAEVKAHLGDAYDAVLRDPVGPVNDPVVRMTAQDIGDVLIERGPAVLNKNGEIQVNKSPFGLVKIIWKHGERSKEPEGARVTREDVTRLPEVMNDWKPIEDKAQPDGRRLIEWQLERQDGRRVVYSVRKFTEGDREQHVVSIFINRMDQDKFKAKPLSEMKNRPATESSTAGAMPGVRDTGREPLLSSRGGQEGGSGRSMGREGQDGQAEPVELALMHQAVKDNPDLMVIGEDGQVVRASDLAKAADKEAADAETMAKGYEAAASCFLRSGG